MPPSRYHDIWNYVYKIKDTSLALIVTNIVNERYDDFYMMNIPGLSKLASGATGWNVCHVLCQRVDRMVSILGKNSMDWDIIYALALVSLTGMHKHISKARIEGWAYHHTADVYIGPEMNNWKDEYIVYMERQCKKYKLKGMNTINLLDGIGIVNEKINRDKLLSLSREVFLFHILFVFTVKF